MHGKRREEWKARKTESITPYSLFTKNINKTYITFEKERTIPKNLYVLARFNCVDTTGMLSATVMAHNENNKDSHRLSTRHLDENHGCPHNPQFHEFLQSFPIASILSMEAVGSGRWDGGWNTECLIAGKSLHAVRYR